MISIRGIRSSRESIPYRMRASIAPLLDLGDQSNPFLTKRMNAFTPSPFLLWNIRAHASRMTREETGRGRGGYIRTSKAFHPETQGRPPLLFLPSAPPVQV